MTEKTLDDVITFMKHERIKDIIVSGGEPTEHPQFYRFINKIIAEVKPSLFFIASNGMFVDDKQKTEEMRELLRNPAITSLQVTNVHQYYPRADIIGKIKALDFKDRIFIADKLIDIINLGRAVKNHPDARSFRGTSCANFYLLARQGIEGLGDMIRTLELNSTSSVCKPMVDVDGFIHVGEFLDCTKLGHVKTINMKEAAAALKTSRPCDKCGAYKNLSYLIKTIIESE